jgi:hypothetical protein
MPIGFVRRTPNLKWLRSDLTPEGFVMLQQDRPDVTFVSQVVAGARRPRGKTARTIILVVVDYDDAVRTRYG